MGVSVALVAAALIGAVLWVRHFHGYTPVEVAQDLRAAMAARNAERPVERFLEVRYGPLTEATNRQKAFVDFFNVGHIEGLQLIVRRAPPQHRAHAIDGMAQWVAEYRRNLTPQEKASLREFFHQENGRATLERATAKYLTQDVYYRAATTRVINELMATLVAIEQP